MDLKESINSDDIEIAQLSVNLLLKEINIINIEDLLEKTKYRVDTFDRDYIVLKKRFGDGLYSQMKKGNIIKLGKMDKKTFENELRNLFK